MLDAKLLRENPDEARAALARRGRNPKEIDSFLEVDGRWRALSQRFDEARRELKELSLARAIEKAKVLKVSLKSIEEELSLVTTERDNLLSQLPNMPFAEVPSGKDDSENPVLRTVGTPGELKVDYLTLARNLDLLDVERSATVSGSRFSYLKNELVLLEFGLIRFALDLLLPHGFTPIIPPQMIRPEVYRGMGRLSGGQEEERYFLAKDDLYLIGSAEHTMGPYHAGDVFLAKDLPRRYVGFSTCFRREAGSYGKDTKGILRVHQFDKVEMFSFAHPEKSGEEHQFLLARQEELHQKLGLPYRIVEICTGDLGFTDAKAYDTEVWLPSEGRYRETGSCSNTTDFQARGIDVRYRDEAQGPIKGFAHLLNATGLAIGRTLIMIMENYQTETGTILVPEVLIPYVGFKEITTTKFKGLGGDR